MPKHIRLTTCLFLILTVCAAFGAAPVRAESLRDDGQQWIKMGKEEKLAYLRGIAIGMGIYHRMVYKVVVEKEAATAYDLLYKTYSKAEKYLTNVSFEQARDAMDKFYEDPGNRKIQIYDAFWVILKKVNGEDTSKIVTKLKQ